MILYKYFPPTRIDVLQNLKIRFSQPAVYNDPFELRPRTISEITEAQFAGILPILVRYHNGAEDEKAEIGAITYENFQTNPDRVLWLIQEVMTSGSLALSLTEVPDDLLMWAHYGFYHKGFVLGFDSKHEFLTCPKGTYYPAKISYKQVRPTVKLPRPDNLDTFFTKSVHWEYEKEWRLFRELPEGVQPEQFTDKDRDGYPIYLFDLPAAAIKEIIFGCRMSFEDEQEIRRIVGEKLHNVVIKRAELCQRDYRVNISVDG